MFDQEIHIHPITDIPQHWAQAAQWASAAWSPTWPEDTPQYYMAQYAQSGPSNTRLLEVYAAIGPEDRLLGTATLIDDDELPDAIELGPWLAAVYVDPEARRMGVGRALIDYIAKRAWALGYSKLYLYTHDQQAWYEKAGWIYLRQSRIHGTPQVVMMIESKYQS